MDDLRRSEHDHGVITLTIDRPHQLNAMTPSFFAGLPSVMAELSADEECRAVVVTGAGKHFSTGGDLNSFLALESSTDHRQHMQRAFRALSSVAAFPKPVVAAVEGIAYAGGLEIAAACDIVIAGSEARFCLPEVGIGLLPAFGLRHLTAAIGTRRARWLAMTGQPVDAATAHDWGLVEEIVAPGTALDRSTEIARHLATLPPPAVLAIKNFIDREDATLAVGVDINVQLFDTTEHKDAVRAFLDRRKPDS